MNYSPTELEQLYKQCYAESHEFAINSVYSAGYSAGYAAGQSAAPQPVDPDPAQAAVEAVVLAPTEQAIVATVDSTEAGTPAELIKVPT